MSEPKLHLLHVENDQMEAELFQHHLTQEFGEKGYTLVQVESLGEALKKLKETYFNAILLDLDLTDIQGLDNVRAIKEENPDIPIVVLSGHDDTKIALSAVRLGAQEYMVKGHSNSRMLGLAVLSSIERKAYERDLFRQANYDDLTGLPNRRMFLEYMKQWIIRASRWKRTEAIMFFDVDGFKKVNDTLGHDIGDALLKQIAARLRIALRASDMLARYGGDEFIAHLDTDANISKEVCTDIAEKIIAVFTDCITIGSHDIRTGVSIGIAFYPEHGKDTAELIQQADQAMYRARKEGKSICFANAEPGTLLQQ